ncbi:hypothetical protein [Vibrio sp. CAU 1672]|uniref:hypothetical protein n=1 Tax=Vibrio sp. CAU 1672 TaxID=3032594 RepID=UPI0023DA7E7E|nr:hypothetical protein [Vibrio sp. CAU 1672]MDF2155368.1 hypothetical protein [Vibrio sp. CAU 1672]
MNRKLLLPIPLILLIPVLLLIVVVAAGLYRFTLSDDDIMAKFPQAADPSNVIVAELLGIQSANPWTLHVPEAGAVSFLDEWDKEHQYLKGDYDAGAARGEVLLPTDFIRSTQIDGTPWIVSPLIVTSQGTGAFYYLALFKFDPAVSRVVMVDSIFIGDRIKLASLNWHSDHEIRLVYFAHGEEQAKAEEPNQLIEQMFRRSANQLLIR